MQPDTNPHRPLHISSPHGWYFLTAHTIDNQYIFHDNERKKLLISTIIHAQKKFHARIYGYIIWPNHYHMIVSLPGNTLAKFVASIHSFSSRFVNEKDGTMGHRVWYQYWDRYLRLEKNVADFYYRISYLLHNPVKHGWCQTFDQAVTYPWSSLPTWVKRYGKQGLADVWYKYPVTDWSEEVDESVE